MKRQRAKERENKIQFEQNILFYCWLYFYVQFTNKNSFRFIAVVCTRTTSCDAKANDDDVWMRWLVGWKFMLAHRALNVNGGSRLAINLQRCIFVLTELCAEHTHSNSVWSRYHAQIPSGCVVFYFASGGDLMCQQANKLAVMHTLTWAIVKGGGLTKWCELISSSPYATFTFFSLPNTPSSLWLVSVYFSFSNVCSLLPQSNLTFIYSMSNRAR